MAEGPVPPNPNRTIPILPGSFDEVPPGHSDSGLGPIDEFTLSLRTDPSDPSPGPVPEPPPRPAPSPPPPARPVAPPAAQRRPPRPIPDPLTTGVVSPEDVALALSPPVASRPPGLSDATMALMMDGIEERPAEEPSVGLPEVMMPPQDTARSRGMAPMSGPAALSLDPWRDGGGAAEDRSDDVVVMEAPPPDRVRPAPRSVATPRQRPEPRPPPSGPSTQAVAAPNRPARLASPDAASGSGGLDLLLTLAEEPPEREETIGASLELMRLVDAPPEREETISSSLEQMEPPPVPTHVRPRAEASPAPDPVRPPLELVSEVPPVGEETLSGALEPVGNTVTELETRPLSTAEFRVAGLSGPPPAHSRLGTAQLRRPTWSPGSPPGAEGSRPEPRPEREGRERRRERPEPPANDVHDPPDESGSVFRDPVLLGAASLIGLIVFLTMWGVLVLVLVWIV